MASDKEKRSGVRVTGNEPAIDALRKTIPHWVHDKIKYPASVTGFLYTRECTCSACGYRASFEKASCPHCGRKMEEFKGL